MVTSLKLKTFQKYEYRALKIFIAIASTSTSENTKIILPMENNLCTKCLF